jgi:excisionase family DNA binding protein
MTQTHLPPLDERQRYSVPEACGYLRIGRKYLYDLIAAGELPVIKDGRRTFVPGSAIAARSRAQAA